MSIVSTVRVIGPLAGFTGGFAAELARLGYAPRSAEEQLRLMGHVSNWLLSHGLAVGDLDESVVARYVAARRLRYRKLRSARAVRPLLEFLRSSGAAPVPGPAGATGPVDEVLVLFAEYLRTGRGLAPATVSSYLSQVTVFLKWRADRYGVDWGTLTARQVHEFVVVRARGQQPRSLQFGVNALRALLRWLGARGVVAAGLAGGLGSVAVYTLSGLPKALTDVEAEQLLTGLQVPGPVRLRNEAMLALLRRVGLRAGEVARLRLDDIHWRAGVLDVRGKGGRRDQVPLPVDVGELIVAYLRDGRPVGFGHRNVFLAVDAPHRPIGAAAVSDVVARAAAAAGMQQSVRAHRLRHTTGRRVLAAGGGLVETGQLLRHASVGATSVYAKVDVDALAVLARPWPASDVDER